MIDHKIKFKKFFLFTDERERERARVGRERKKETDRQTSINLLLHPFVHSLVDSCMCPDWRLNLQLWSMRTTL